jgi:AcrR family transcriptional regulator
VTPRTARRAYESPLRQEQAAATRDRILEATAALLGDEHPATLSIPAVAGRAGVSIRTVYRHFDTKEALLDGLYDWSRNRLTQDRLPDEPDLDMFKQVMPDAFRTVLENRDFYRAMHNSGVGGEVQERKGSEDRRRLMQAAARKAAPDLARGDTRRLAALLHLLTWSNTVIFLADNWGMSADEAARTCTWAAEQLAAAAAQSEGVGR